MKYLKTLKDEDVFTCPKYSTPDQYEDRKTVKIIIENEKGEIALVTNPVHKCFLLPGGGAETDNLYEEARRESLEETRYHVKISGTLNTLYEYRNRNKKHYITTCFLAKALKEDNNDLRTEEEKENGLEVKWVDKNKALKILSKQVDRVKKGEIEFYNTAFNIVRDNHFLKQSSSVRFRLKKIFFSFTSFQIPKISKNIEMNYFFKSD